MAESEDLELFHYGVKGMKWGVRRPIGPDGLVRRSSAKREERRKEKEAFKASKEKARQDSDKARRQEKLEDRYNRNRDILRRPVSDEARTAERARKRIRSHGTDAMSNKELQDLVTRMNLEQQYSALVDNKKASSRRAGVKQYVVDILKESGSQLAKDAMVTGVKMAFEAYMGKRNSGGSRTPAYIPTTLIEKGGRRQIER